MFNQRPIVTHKLIDPKIPQGDWNQCNNVTTKNFVGLMTIVLETSKVYTSQAIDLRQVAQDGIFSLQDYFTGSGVMTWTYTVSSTENGTYFTPAGAADIATSQTTGRYGVSFEPEMFPWMKIVGTETGTNTATLTELYLNVQ